MAWIFDRYNLNNRLQLGYEEYLRPMLMGTEWQVIRIGIRFAVNDASRGEFQRFALLLGVCQGLSGVQAASTTDYIGGGIFGTALPPTGGRQCYSFAAGPPSNWNCPNAPNGLRKTGTTYVYGTYSSVTTYVLGTGVGGAYAAQNMGHVYVQITKGSPNYSVVVYYPGSATNITDTVFITNMETTATPTSTNAASTVNLAYSGSGLFDTLSIAYYKSFPTIEIDAIGVTRLL